MKKANLRVGKAQFTQELLREHRKTVGRLDARFTGVTFDPLSEEAQYDPQSAAISAAFTAAFLDYYHQELKFGSDKTYRVTNYQIGEQWDWKHKIPGSRATVPFANTVPDLAQAMGYNPDLEVLVLNGYYDLATPFFATESMMAHLGLTQDLRSHVTMKYYEAGHMMYVYEPSLQTMKTDIAAFIDQTDHH